MQQANCVSRGAWHDFTVNTATGEIAEDDPHVTAEMGGGKPPRMKVHVYLEGEGEKATVSRATVLTCQGRKWLREHKPWLGRPNNGRDVSRVDYGSKPGTWTIQERSRDRYD